MTPIQVAHKQKKTEIIDFLVSLGAQDPWKKVKSEKKAPGKEAKTNDKLEPKKFVLTKRDPVTQQFVQAT